MVAGVSSATAAGGIPSASSRASISRDQFLKILVSELTSQDPLEPMNNNDFIQQLVGLQSLEQTANLTDSLSSFERFMQMSSGSTMIGKSVKGLAANGEQVQGVVTKVVLENGTVNVVVGSRKVPVDSITEILAQ
ncbi:MAG TPA: flagellar hook capping FlgD N-terminal domain-containing protein [Planctomycetota bacterium]|nr:flagellar hook capping FlgD N-terminal domain-containing protein [Planctomycetota bacterium]